MFAVQPNRVIRAHKEQLWQQHLSSSSFSVDLSCYIDLCKKSHGCHAGCRVNQAFDRLTSFFKKLSHHKVNFKAFEASSRHTKLAKSSSSYIWIVSQDFVGDCVFASKIACMKSSQWKFSDSGQDEGDFSLACSSSCQLGHSLWRLWRRGLAKQRIDCSEGA